MSIIVPEVKYCEMKFGDRDGQDLKPIQSCPSLWKMGITVDYKNKRQKQKAL
jgi:hypothetical protein